MVIEKDLFSESLTYNQWANKLFGYEKNSSLREDYISKVKREYSIYFTHDFKFSFIEGKIKRDFPRLFGIVEDDDGDYSSEDQVRDNIKALDKEIEEQKDPNNIETFKGNNLTLIHRQENSYIYQVDLSITDGQEPNLHSDIPFILRVYDKDVLCEAVEYDIGSGRLYFSSLSFLKPADFCKILLDSSFNIEKLRQRLVEITENGVNEDLPYAKFLFGETENLVDVPHKKVPISYKEGLDESQKKAFDAALDKDITFIWGPPGTGKSFTLASIIYALYELGEDRTVVCCLSNVAVDQLLSKVLDVIEKNKKRILPGNIYRAGRTRDSKIISTDYLFPNDQLTQSLRNKIKCNSELLSKLKERKKDKTEEAILLKAENKDLRDQLKDQTEFLVKRSRLVFSTISNFVLSNTLYESRFDNLIVDEASMMAMPSLLALGHKISKRLIFVGDFQQLSPIALVKDHTLMDSVFELSEININNTDHPALHQLLHQRRSNEKIVGLINKTFYAGKLIPSAKESHNIIQSDPYPGKIIALDGVKNGAVRFTKGGTRQNTVFAESVIALLDEYAKDKRATFSIGVITPYRGQASLLRALMFGQKYPIEFENRVKIGTIHTFQGSECDVIIYDMVDCPRLESGRSLQIGKIYAAGDGERLVNVAVSRARHKLIVVCDPDYIKNIPGSTISDNTRALFQKLSKYITLQDYKEENVGENNSEWYFVESVPFTKASKEFLSYKCRVVLSTLGYYLEVTGDYIKLGDYPKGFSYENGSVWIKKARDSKGQPIVHDISSDSHLIGYIREEDDKIVYTNSDDEVYTITFNEE